ncbi:TlpA disulfide reductase family protein [Yeosuana marina]|uniref:TlpA family protein disulfide reductase n=1 Tax=Yeosuana marina TaxID=1565536 RepID=UPI0030EE0C21|tara:strand:+ start:4893 stop:6062 length:1170 start_codon:yes stop_codon:yes gene_type:complete
MNNHIKLLLLLFITISFASCTKESNKASLSISSTGQENDSVWIELYPYDKPQSSFIKLKLNDGLINLDTLINVPHFGKIMFPTKLDNGKLEYTFSKHIEFFINPKEKIQINSLFYKNQCNYEIHGNNFNTELKQYNMEIAEETKNIDAIFREINNRFPNEHNWSLPGIDSLLRQRQPFVDAIEYKTENFINANLDHEIAAYLMYYYPKEKVKELFPLLSEKAKRSTYGKLVEEKLSFWASLDSGAAAPNFQYKTIDNKKISLDKQKGKYVLLDFWGTWCPPCRNDIPDLKIFYNDNKDYLEIIGISCNDEYDSWKNLIIEKQMNWIQIFNNPQNEDLTKTYDINVFPTKILIGPDGKIIQTIKGSGKETFDKLNKLITISKSKKSTSES